MRPLRLLLLLSSCVLAVTLLLYIVLPTRNADAEASQSRVRGKRSSLHALFSFSAPALFPPSAVISLTDDKSTFFLARPAAFGPPLPSKGLSGQLWTGSGFDGDTLHHGDLAADVDGELGCSDVPGWDEGRGRLSSPASGKAFGASVGRLGSGFRRALLAGRSWTASTSKPASDALVDDGTDDHALSDQPEAFFDGKTSPKAREHADIQSLQESAEIAGKVVLLRRGGCGFLEKVTWAQRRGGVAVIIGDDVRGRRLVTMYAHGDTSNITIPALFTSHTTAHFLSSLVPSGGITQTSSADDRPKSRLGKGPTFTASSPASPTSNRAIQGAQSARSQADARAASSREQRGWIRTILTFFAGGPHQDVAGEPNVRPPSSGKIDWILVQDWQDGEPTMPRGTPTAAHKSSPTPETMSNEVSDGFVIGVQDWRDPDLLPPTAKTQAADDSSPQTTTRQLSIAPSLAGSYALPGSGEYAEPVTAIPIKASTASTANDQHDNSGGWLSSMFWNKHSDSHAKTPGSKLSLTSTPTGADAGLQNDGSYAHAGFDTHEGLWVTLAPTSISSSPFFDTLLVLVISPLVTLTVVYSLLLLRSRIRRRRWRAPKSVVESLPIRTYYTLRSSCSSATASPVSAPTAGNSRTPLLQQPQQQPSNAVHTSAPHNPPDSATRRHGNTPQLSALRPVSTAEKAETGLAAWRRKYGGRQKECVVCLEEYVDGVSKVMSLPCGHEFHAECITPWLTTRRRTCPICKGDVVRSLASSSRAHHLRASVSSTVPSPTRPTRGIRRMSGDEHNGDANFDVETVPPQDDAPLTARAYSVSGMESADEHDLEGGGNDEEHGGLASWTHDGLHRLQSWTNNLWANHDERADSGERSGHDDLDRSR